MSYHLAKLPDYWPMQHYLPDDNCVTEDGLSDEMADFIGDYPAAHWDHTLPYRGVVRTATDAVLDFQGWKRGKDKCAHGLVDGNAVSCWRSRSKPFGCELAIRLSNDHFDSFVKNDGTRGRQATAAGVVSQPYPSPNGCELVLELADAATQLGLCLWASARQSFYLPGRTYLIAVTAPGGWRPAEDAA